MMLRSRPWHHVGDSTRAGQCRATAIARLVPAGGVRNNTRRFATDIYYLATGRIPRADWSLLGASQSRPLDPDTNGCCSLAHLRVAFRVSLWSGGRGFYPQDQ